MNPGRYDKRLVICSVIHNDDGMGGSDVVTSDLITVWASLLPFNSNQAIQYSQLTTSQGYNIEFRGLKQFNITTNHGLKYNGRLFSIHSCDTMTDPMKTKIIAFEQ